MNIEDLKAKLNFILNDEIQKNIYIYVTSPKGLQLFNIVEDDLNELMPIYVGLIKSLVLERDGLSLGDYSMTVARENMIYRYDLSLDRRTQEMINMSRAGTEQNPDLFTVNNDSLEKINGFYVVIKSVENRVVFYKQILPIDKTYGRSSFFLGIKDNEMFERKKDSLLRLVPGIQMLYVDDTIILVEMNKLEASLGLDAILQKEAATTFRKIEERNIVLDITKLKEACDKPSMLKKLRHALTVSKVKDLSNDNIIQFAKQQNKLKFKFDEERNKFNIDSQAAAKRFIKLLDDDYLFSKLTSTDYDSEQKGILVEVLE